MGPGDGGQVMGTKVLSSAGLTTLAAGPLTSVCSD